MKFNIKQSKAPLSLEKYSWHSYFAWKPVRITPIEVKWLCTVERKAVFVGNSWEYQYR